MSETDEMVTLLLVDPLHELPFSFRKKVAAELTRLQGERDELDNSWAFHVAVVEAEVERLKAERERLRELLRVLDDAVTDTIGRDIVPSWVRADIRAALADAEAKEPTP